MRAHAESPSWESTDANEKLPGSARSTRSGGCRWFLSWCVSIRTPPHTHIYILSQLCVLWHYPYVYDFLPSQQRISEPRFYATPHIFSTIFLQPSRRTYPVHIRTYILCVCGTVRSRPMAWWCECGVSVYVWHYAATTPRFFCVVLRARVRLVLSGAMVRVFFHAKENRWPCGGSGAAVVVGGGPGGGGCRRLRLCAQMKTLALARRVRPEWWWFFCVLVGWLMAAQMFVV